MHYKFNILIVLLIIVTKTISYNLESENIHFYHSLILIIKDIFVKDVNPLLFYMNFNNSSKKDLHFANDFINAAFDVLKDMPLKLLYQQSKTFENFRHNEVMIFDNLESMRFFYKNMYSVGSKNLSRALMLITSITTLDFETISLVFKDLYHMGVLNIGLLLKLAPDNIVMVSYFPFAPTSCHDISPVIINHYLPDQKRWKNLDYFPSKLKDFYGCPLTCCAWANMPYFSKKYDPDNVKFRDFIGLEAEILNFMGRNMNFSIKIHLMDNTIPKSEYNEGTIFKKVFAETCDFALGGFAFKSSLNATSPISQTNYFFLSHIHFVTNILNDYSAYEKIAFPFHSNVWYTLGLILAMSSFLIGICERRPQWKRYRNFIIGSVNKTPHLNLYAVAFGANLTNAQVPKRNFARFLLTCWILATLVLRCAYQSGMYQMLRDNAQRNPPQTIEQVFKRNYLISMTPENRRYLPILPEVKRMHIFNSTIFPAYPELLKAKEQIAFITPIEYFGYFGKVNVNQWRNLHLVTERILTNQLTFYIRHHSYLIHELNDQIADLQYYGFIKLWNRKYSNPQIDSSLQRSGADGNNDIDKISNKNVLSMQELGAVFMILIFLHLISSVLFLIELVCGKYGRQLDSGKN